MDLIREVFTEKTNPFHLQLSSHFGREKLNRTLTTCIWTSILRYL